MNNKQTRREFFRILPIFGLVLVPTFPLCFPQKRKPDPRIFYPKFPLQIDIPTHKPPQHIV